MSVVKVSRSALRLSSSSRPGSWIVISPRESASTFSGRMSRAITRWPTSAKQAAVTRPTQPTPITPIGSLLAAHRFALPLLRFWFGNLHVGRARHPDHLVVAQRIEQVVGDPVGVVAAVPGDQRDPVAVDVDVVFATVDRLASGSGCRGSAGPTSPGSPACRSSGCRRRAGQLDHHPVGAVARPVGVLEVVDARVLDVLVGVAFDVVGARGQPGREEDGEAGADLAAPPTSPPVRRLRGRDQPVAARRLRLRCAASAAAVLLLALLAVLACPRLRCALRRGCRAGRRWLRSRGTCRPLPGSLPARRRRSSARVRPGSGPP